jgi:hypothetical protein
MPTQKSGKGRTAEPPPAKDRPVKVIRMKNIRANIWANRLEGGGVIYNTTIDRLWKEDDETDGGGQVVKEGQWQKSESFGKDDLLLVAKVADLAHTWIYNRIQDDRREDGF